MINISIVINKGNKYGLPFSKHTKNYGKSPFLMGKSTISMVIDGNITIDRIAL